VADNAGVIADPLFVGITRPAMAWGVTYSALLINGVLTVEAFLLTRNLLCLLLAIPLHGLFWVACLSEPRFLELWSAWAQSALRHGLANTRYWGVASRSPLSTARLGRRQCPPTVLL
jgi:type IV secretion system protein VirB3